VAWGLLARTARGEAFVIDPAALTDEPHAVFGLLADGRWHAATIDSLVGAATTARTGEQAVRIAYTLARTEGLVTERIANAAMHAAALARDRRLAVETRSACSRRRGRTRRTTRSTSCRCVRDARRLRAETPLLADALTPDAAASVQVAERLLTHMRQQSASIRNPERELAGVDSAAADTVTADTVTAGIVTAGIGGCGAGAPGDRRGRQSRPGGEPAGGAAATNPRPGRRAGTPRRACACRSRLPPARRRAPPRGPAPRRRPARPPPT
jgi:hypothetical protein